MVADKWLQINGCRYYVDPNLIKNRKHCEFGDLLIAGVSENKQEVGKAVAYLGKEKPIIGDKVHLIRHNQNPKFMAYIFSTRYVRKQIENIATPSTIFNLYIRKIRSIKVPLPPLKEQERIVQILDKLNDNLKDLDIKAQELIGHRDKQYNLQCNQILSSNQ